MPSGKNYLFRFAAVLILVTGFALQTPAGTIGYSTTNWNSWSEAAGLLAARKWMS